MLQASSGRRASAASVSMVASSRGTSACGTTTVRDPRPPSSHPGLARADGPSCSNSSPKRTTAPERSLASSKTCTCPRPISVIVPGVTAAGSPSTRCRPLPVRVHISS